MKSTLAIILALQVSCQIRAQQWGFTYDSPGNLLSITEANSLGLFIIAQPRSQVVEPNGTATFSVVAAGMGLSYQWLSNGVPIAGATGDSLILNNLTGTNFALYSVIISSASSSLTSSAATVWMDSTGTGMPDWWQLEYFGNLNQLPTGDAVGDGLPNLEKFYEGINPTNGAGLSPRLFLNGLNGRITALPDLPHYALEQVVTLTAAPAPGFQFAGWTGDLSGTNSPANLTMDTNKYVTAIFGLPLGYAVDATNLAWRTGGDVPWFGQNYVTYDGIAAAQSGPIGTNQQSWMETTVVMDLPGTVSFWWKYVPGSGTPTFSVNGTAAPGLSFYESDWQQATCYLPAGTDVLRWTYSKSSSDFNDSGFDTFWVDQVMVTAYADPLLDTDKDGLPDLWEYRYFGHLGFTGTDDPDSDGVNNHDEYLDGTDPTDPTSVFPRLTISSSGGTVTVSPDLAKYSYLQPITLTATPDPGLVFMEWRGDLSGSTNPLSLNINRSLVGRAVFALTSPGSLAEAVDATNLTWTTGGDVPWFAQTAITHDGVAAEQSGSIGAPNQASWIRTTVIGPGPLSFWWNSGPGYCCADLEFAIDGVMRTNSSSGVWEQQTFSILSGTHTLQWMYTNSPTGGDPRNAAWLDQVSFGTGVPALTTLPVSKTVLQGSNVTFAVVASSSGALSYQWQKNGIDLVNGGSISGATGATLALSNVQTNDSGSYSVTVSTAAGAASSAATLTVIGLVPLSQALDSPQLVWSSGGAVPWFGQTTVSHDGNSAGQSGSIAGGRQSWVQTTLTGPGVLSFWWKTSGETGDQLLLLVGGNTNASIAGQVDWVPRSFLIPAGSQTVRWLAAPFFNRATSWLDQVAFTPGTPPSITLPPQSQTVVAGSNVSFSISATGAAPLRYQWLFDGTNLIGKTDALLTITNVQPANAGDYAVIVSNSIGSTLSADAQLTVAGPKAITPQNLIAELANGGVTIQFAGTPKAGYTVIATTDLSLPEVNWTVLGPATEYASGLFQFIDVQTSNSSMRFYRVRSP